MSLFKSHYKIPAILIVFIAVLVAIGTAGFTSPPDKDGQKIVVHLKHFTDDLHAAFMAVKLAGALETAGADVTLFVNLEGARLADARITTELKWGPGEMPLIHYYDAFIAAGGELLICPHCAHAAGVDPENLRKGAKVATEGEVVKVLMEADKILDY